MIHVALVSAYPTEAEARAALDDGRNYAPGYAAHAGTDAPYLGIWRQPAPFGNVLHVFTERPAADLEVLGWIREDTP